MAAFATVASSATATTAIAAGTFATALRAFFAGAGNIDGERAALEFFSIKHLDGFGRFFRAGELDESEAAGFAGEFIEHEVYGSHIPSLGKEILNILFQRLVRKVTDEESCGVHGLVGLIGLHAKARSERVTARGASTEANSAKLSYRHLHYVTWLRVGESLAKRGGTSTPKKANKIPSCNRGCNLILGSPLQLGDGQSDAVCGACGGFHTPIKIVGVRADEMNSTLRLNDCRPEFFEETDTEKFAFAQRSQWITEPLLGNDVFDFEVRAAIMLL